MMILLTDSLAPALFVSHTLLYLLLNNLTTRYADALYNLGLARATAPELLSGAMLDDAQRAAALRAAYGLFERVTAAHEQYGPAHQNMGTLALQIGDLDARAMFGGEGQEVPESHLAEVERRARGHYDSAARCSPAAHPLNAATRREVQANIRRIRERQQQRWRGLKQQGQQAQGQQQKKKQVDSSSSSSSSSSSGEAQKKISATLRKARRMLESGDAEGAERSLATLVALKGGFGESRSAARAICFEAGMLAHKAGDTALAARRYARSLGLADKAAGSVGAAGSGGGGGGGGSGGGAHDEEAMAAAAVASAAAAVTAPTWSYAYRLANALHQQGALAHVRSCWPSQPASQPASGASPCVCALVSSPPLLAT